MPTEFQLVIETAAGPAELAARAFPGAEESFSGPSTLLSADLYAEYGFGLSVLHAGNGYFDTDPVRGTGPWQPERYTVFVFGLENSSSDRAIVNMVAAVNRVLTSGTEDVIFVLNSDWLLLDRTGGVLTRRRPDWWDNYPAAERLIDG
jgi:hypothetical protein